MEVILSNSEQLLLGLSVSICGTCLIANLICTVKYYKELNK